jgi:2-succinyl-5-enolpyruvyl-6-hydroxy-3-cyclohexene-1-carboxylate synthase
MTSKRYLQFVKHQKVSKYINITGLGRRQDPANLITDRYQGDIRQICLDLAEEITARNSNPAAELFAADKKIQDMLKRKILLADSISEISVARFISKYLPESHGLFLGNSMPIRDFDMYADFSHTPVSVGSNRGASGIDGTLATAVGFAAGCHLPVTLVLGDLAMLHDLNSLALLKRAKQPLVIVVINNNGGGIFSFLSIAGYKDVFEKYFATPTDVDFKPAAAMFDLGYARPASNQELVDTYQEAVRKSKSVLIEVASDRQKNLEFHTKIQQDILKIL